MPAVNGMTGDTGRWSRELSATSRVILERSRVKFDAFLDESGGIRMDQWTQGAVSVVKDGARHRYGNRRRITLSV